VVNKWFESVAVAERRARRVLPKAVYDALVAGSERGSTMSDNVAAFAEIGLLPVAVDQPAERQMATSVMGQRLSMPVLISPTGVQAVHPGGEVAVARAAASRGVAYGLSSFAGKPIEEVVAANPQTLFQTYWAGGRDAIVARIERARSAGAVGLILTTDWSFSHSRDWGSPSIPQRIDLPTMIRQAPGVVTKPRWLLRWARAGLRPPGLEVPNFAPLGQPAPAFFAAYGEWMQTPPPTWDDVAWLVEQWNGPFMLKGVMRADDAKRAIDIGVTAISVSNHGGNNVDGSPAPIRVLHGIGDAVGGQIEVVMDGGVRRGSDVIKAVALGARAVMIGRAALWGLAAAGQSGVENVLDVLRNGIDSTLLGIGKQSIDKLSPADLLIPSGFSPG